MHPLIDQLFQVMLGDLPEDFLRIELPTAMPPTRVVTTQEQLDHAAALQLHHQMAMQAHISAHTRLQVSLTKSKNFELSVIFILMQ